jgi:hypothetical protein
MSRLTEANYLSRRVKLTNLLVEARTALSDVGIRRELDEATDAAVIAAKGEVTTLEDRIVALDAAWERTQAEVAVAAAAAEAASAAGDHATIMALLAERTAAGLRMDEAAKALAAEYAAYHSAGDTIRKIATRHSRRFGLDRLRNLADLFLDNFHDVRPAIGRTLVRGGLNMQNINADGFVTDSLHQRSVTAFVEWTTLRAEQHIAPLLEDQGDRA